MTKATNKHVWNLVLVIYLGFVICHLLFII